MVGVGVLVTRPVLLPEAPIVTVMLPKTAVVVVSLMPAGRSAADGCEVTTAGCVVTTPGWVGTPVGWPVMTPSELVCVRKAVLGFTNSAEELETS